MLLQHLFRHILPFKILPELFQSIFKAFSTIFKVTIPLSINTFSRLVRWTANTSTFQCSSWLWRGMWMYLHKTHSSFTKSCNYNFKKKLPVHHQELHFEASCTSYTKCFQTISCRVFCYVTKIKFFYSDHFFFLILLMRYFEIKFHFLLWRILRLNSTSLCTGLIFVWK